MSDANPTATAGPKLVQFSYSRKSQSSYRVGTSPVVSPSAPPYSTSTNKADKSPSPAGRSPVSAPSTSPELSPHSTSPTGSASNQPTFGIASLSVPNSNQGTPITGPQATPFLVTATSTNKRYTRSTDNMLTPVEDGLLLVHNPSPQLSPASVLIRQSPPLAPRKSPAAPPPMMGGEMPDARTTQEAPTSYTPPSRTQNRFAALEKKKPSSSSPASQPAVNSPSTNNTEAMPAGIPDFNRNFPSTPMTVDPDEVVAEAQEISKRRAKREAFEAKKAKRKAYAEQPPVEHEEFNSDYSSSANAKSVEVPLIQPKYEKSYRQSRSMSVSDSQSDTCRSASELRERSSHETLKIVNGRNAYTTEVTFDTYAMYKFGKNKVITDSVGYARDGDLLLTREDVQSESDSDRKSFGLKKTDTSITGAVCIDSRARRPMTSGEEATLAKRKQLNLKKNKKYPGIRAPRDKKIINRLQNDSLMAHPLFRELLLGQGVLAVRSDGRGEALELVASLDSSTSGDDEDGEFAARKASLKVSGKGRRQRKPKGAFEQKKIPQEFKDMFHRDEEVQNAYLERKGISPVFSASMPNFSSNSRHQPPTDPNDPESRFQVLNARLKQEIKHALGGSEFLTDLAVELEEKFTSLILEARQRVEEGDASVKRQKNIVEPLEFSFRDGYGRLVCHAVAAYYRLVSTSDNNSEGKRVTVVTLPGSERARTGALDLPNSTLVKYLLKNYKAKAAAAAPPGGGAEVGDALDEVVDGGMGLPTLSLDDNQADRPRYN